MLTLTIPAPCEPLTANQRLHWAVKAQRTKAWRARAHVAAIQAGRPRLDRAHATVTIHRTDRRSYDAGNWYPTAKACLDGIVTDAHVLPDDSNTYLVGPDLRQGDKADRFTVAITLDPDCGCHDCRPALWHCDLCPAGFWGDPPDACWHGVTACGECLCADCAIERRRP